MALLDACDVSQSPKNTGIDCSVAMGAAAMYIFMPDSAVWQASDEVDFYAYIQTQMHALPNVRWFPMFGNKAPIRTINDTPAADTIVTYDDLSQAFILAGTISKKLMTNKGGLAYAAALRSFNGFKGFAFIEIDKFGKVLRKINSDGSRSGIPLNMMSAPTPDMATFKQEFQPAFLLNYSADEYIGNGNIAKSDQNLLDIMGLINAEVTLAAAATTTKLKIGVRTIGTKKDLVAAYAAIADPTAFVVTKKSDGSVNVISAAAVVSGHVELTGTFTSAAVYNVAGSTAAALKALAILGYEITGSLDITIP